MADPNSPETSGAMDDELVALRAQVTALRREVDLLRSHLRRVDRDLESTRPLIKAARTLKIWDFAPYEVAPGTDWVAVDRGHAEHLLAALARVDHWAPWQTRIEPRPRP